MKTHIASTHLFTMTEIQGFEYQINLKSDDFKIVTSKSDQKFFGWFLSDKFCKMGIANAAVFPVPVCALPNKSFPCKMEGIAFS